MLERASSCVEPVALLYLRQIEPPLRSQKVLGSSFWKHGGEHLATPPGWPSYLASIRRCRYARTLQDSSARTFRYENRVEATRQAKSTSIRALSTKDRNNVDIPQHYHEKRSYSVPATATDTSYENVASYGPQLVVPLVPSPQLLVEDESASSEAPVADETRSPDSLGDTPATPQSVHLIDSDVLPLRRNRLDELLAANVAGRQPSQMSEVWLLFVSLPDQQAHASSVLAYMSTSSSSQSRARVLQAYSIIATEDRVKEDYDRAVTAAMFLRRLHLAIEICQEALQRGLGFESRQMLLLHGIDKSLSRVTSTVWISLFAGRVEASPSQNPAEAARNWNIVDNFVNLPELLSKLLRRISHARADPVVGPFKDGLIQVCSALLWRTVFSAYIMNRITPRGILSLFEQAKHWSQLQPDHYWQAMRTLCSIRIKRERADLAMIVYRNLRHSFPEAKVPSDTLNGLIGICGKANYPSATFDYLLGEFAYFHGKPYLPAFHRVLTMYSRHGDIAGVQKTFNTIHQVHGPLTTIEYYNPLLYVHAIRGDVTATRLAFEKLVSEHNIEPDVVSWNILLYAVARSEEPHQIFNVYEEMTAKGVKPDLRTFGTLVGVCSNAGDVNAVTQLLDLANENDVVGIDSLIASLVHAYCLNDDVEEAEILVEAVTEKNPHQSQIRNWNTLLRHHAFQADHKAMLVIQGKMRAAGILPDNMTYAAIMTALVRVGKTSQALQVLRTLHFSFDLGTTPFHYSILLHGFAMEGNRDMVSVISQEMTERFPYNKSSLKSPAIMARFRRSWSKAKIALTDSAHPAQSTELELDESMKLAMNSLSEETSWTKDPQPGIGRARKAQHAASIVALEVLAERAVANQEPHRASELVEQVNDAMERSALSGQPRAPTLPFLTTRLTLASRQLQWDEVQRLWCDIVGSAVKSSVPVEYRRSISSRSHHLDSPNPHDVLDLYASQLAGRGISVLPAHRYVLSMSLSSYMYALESQHRYKELINLPRQTEQLGFKFTGKNWNNLIQTLCRSTKTHHQRLAFATFEKVLLANTPSFSYLLGGKWVDPSLRPQQQPARSLPRKLLEQIRPGVAAPTYYTLVYLAMVLLRFKKQAAHGHVDSLQHLEQEHPATVQLVTRLPYSKDKVQRLLLRGKKIHGDLTPRLRANTRVDKSGVAESRSLIIHLSYEDLRDLSSEPRPHWHRRALNQDAQKRELPERVWGPQISGPLMLSAKSRPESDVELRARLKREQKENMAIINQLHTDLRKEQWVADEQTGDPVIHPSHASVVDLASRHAHGNAKSAASSPEDPEADFEKTISLLQQLDGPSSEATRSSAGPDEEKIPDAARSRKVAIQEAYTEFTEDQLRGSVTAGRSSYLAKALLRPRSQRKERAFTQAKARRRQAVKQRAASRRPILEARRHRRERKRAAKLGARYEVVNKKHPNTTYWENKLAEMAMQELRHVNSEPLTNIGAMARLAENQKPSAKIMSMPASAKNSSVRRRLPPARLKEPGRERTDDVEHQDDQGVSDEREARPASSDHKPFGHFEAGGLGMVDLSVRGR